MLDLVGTQIVGSQVQSQMEEIYPVSMLYPVWRVV